MLSVLMAVVDANDDDGGISGSEYNAPLYDWHFYDLSFFRYIQSIHFQCLFQQIHFPYFFITDKLSLFLAFHLSWPHSRYDALSWVDR